MAEEQQQPSTSTPTMATGSSNEQHSSEELLKQFVADALIMKSQGSGSKLYDQLVGEVQRLKSLVSGLHGQQQDDESQANQKQLVALLRSVTRCLALVKEAYHEVLVTEIMDIKLWTVSSAVREAVLSFLCHAVAVNGSFIQGSLHVLVFNLVPMALTPATRPAGSTPSSWSPSVEEVGVQDAVVAATKRVIELAPTAASRLLPLLVSNMPHKLREKGVHCLYLRGAFAIAENLHNTGLGDGLLPAVVAHLIDIDVDIKWEDIVEVLTDEAREEEKGESPRAFDEPDIFDLEGMSEGEACLGIGGEMRVMEERGGWEGYDGAGIGAVSSANADSHVGSITANGNGQPPLNGNGVNGKPDAATHQDSHEMADKMDSLMELVLAHLKRRIMRGEVQHVWKSLLDAFDSIILLTHRSKFTQFIVFYVASASPVFCCRSLLALLLNKLADRNQAPMVRSACAAYIGSFLARAAFIPEVTVIETFHKLADWCMRYAREEDRRGGLPPIPSGGTITLGSTESLSRHSSFYAACQALLYALCYHMEPLCMSLGGGNSSDPPPEMMAMSFEENKFLAPVAAAGGASSMRDKCAGSVHRLFTDIMPSLLMHPMDPLSWCAKSVVTEFARQSRHLGHDQVASIIASWENRTTNAKCFRPLEIFFPYDPYLLRRSAEPLDLSRTYVSWRRGHPTCVVPDDDDGDEQEHARRVVDNVNDYHGYNGHSEDITNSEDSSSDDSSMGDSDAADSDASDFSSSDSDDSLRRTRFGSMPDSSMSSGGRRYLTRKLPGALKASIMAHTAVGGSPTAGHIPIIHESPSTDGGRSPWGMSPASFFPHNGMNGMSYGSDRFPNSFPKRR